MSQPKSTCDAILLNGEIHTADRLRPIPAEAPLVYEVVRILDGIPLFLEEHLERMQRSLALAGFPQAPDSRAVTEAVRSLTEECAVRNQNLRLNVWREEETVHWTGLFVESHYPDAAMYLQGVPAGLLSMSRHNPNAKVWQQDLKAAVARQCEARGLYEMILVDDAGTISEGSRSNLFFTQGDTLVTAPDEKVLEGITRMKLMELLTRLNIPLIRRNITADELEVFDGAFLTGTSIHLLPLSRIDKWERPSARQPLIHTLMTAFKESVEDYQKARRLG